MASPSKSLLRWSRSQSAEAVLTNRSLRRPAEYDKGRLTSDYARNGKGLQSPVQRFDSARRLQVFPQVTRGFGVPPEPLDRVEGTKWAQKGHRSRGA